MKHESRSSQRGAALLIVLGTLMLVTAAATILVRVAADAQLRRRLDGCTIGADDLLWAAEAPIQDWLANSSGKVVLPSGADQPCIAILHDQWFVAGDMHELRITAWDQLGMVPLELVLAGSPLRASLPSHMLAQIDRVEIDSKVPFGLDLYLYIEDSDSGDSGDSGGHLVSAYPKPQSGAAIAFGEGKFADHPRGDNPGLAMGGQVATHNSTPHRINVNTAPMALIENVLRAANQSGLEQITTARSEGKPAAMSGTFSIGSLPQQTIQLVGSSSIWSFRIDIRVGPVRKSWWATYGPASSRDRRSQSSKYQWECAQRLVIAY